MEIKVLIVDDEKLERVLIKRGFPWEDHGFLVIGEAASGTEALEFIKYRKPELVLTDINMPQMDGLELAEHIATLDENIHVIMITGYREFEYARRAVKLGVEDFLLKPIDMKELKEIALKIREKITKEKARRKEVEMLKQSVSANQDILMESFFQRLVEKRTSQEETEKKLPAYGCEALLEGCCCLSIHLKEERSGEADDRLHKSAMDLLGTNPIDGTIFFLHYMKNIVLFCMATSISDSREIARQIHQMLKENHMDSTIGISRNHQGYGGIAEAFAESEQVLGASVLLGRNRIITYEEYMHIMEKNPNKLVFDWEDFLFSLTNGVSDKVSAAIDDYVNGISNSRVTEVEYLRLTVMDLMSKAGSTLHKYGVSLEQIIGEERLYESIRSIQTVEECRPFLEESIRMILHYHNSKKAKQGNKVVNDALEYINENFCDPALSLKTVAAAVFSNESYLSRVFKKEVGQSLIEYVLKKRIEESIRLLNTTDFKVYEIAENVGFRDSHYFGICFKKHVGVTVKEFKQR